MPPATSLGTEPTKTTARFREKRCRLADPHECRLARLAQKPFSDAELLILSSAEYGLIVLCATIKVMVKRMLKKRGIPPDLQEKATQTVLAQAELLSAIWAAA